MGFLIQKNEIDKTLEGIRAQGFTIVSTNGCFDILHVGHIRYLQKSKSFGDKLVVLLNSDASVRKIKGENRPINNEKDRAEVLLALSSVDYVIIFDEPTPASMLAQIKPNIHTKGADYTVETLPKAECDAVLNNGGKFEFIEFVEGKSTTSILERAKK